MTAVERQPKLEAIDTSVSSFTGNVGDTKSLMRRRFLSAQTSAGVNDLITRYALMIRNIQSVLVQLITDIFITLTFKIKRPTQGPAILYLLICVFSNLCIFALNFVGY